LGKLFLFWVKIGVFDGCFWVFVFVVPSFFKTTKWLSRFRQTWDGILFFG